jgi:hypothetical protein
MKVSIPMDREQADDAWIAASDHVPDEESWGFFSFLDIPPAFCGSGMGGFTWFEDEEQMLEFLSQVAPFTSNLDGEIQSQKHFEVAEWVHNYSHPQYPHLEICIDRMRRGINDVLAGHLKFPWIGSFQGLVSGEHPYAKYIRASFRESLSEEETPGFDEDSVPESLAGPLAEDDLEEFKEFLATWGA